MKFGGVLQEQQEKLQAEKRSGMKQNRQTIFSILALGILAASIYLTMYWISPPDPLPADTPNMNFSAGRAMQDLQFITRKPRPIGISQAHAEVRDFLLKEIRALGLKPQVQETFGVRVFDTGGIVVGYVQNILVRLPGDDAEGAVLLMAHYDSTPGGPGAADNGAGTVAALEILRALRVEPALRQDVIWLFTDGEEPGALGAHAFVAQHPWFDDVRLVINLDTITDAPPVLLKTSTGNGLWVQALARSTSHSASVSLPYHLFSGSETDLLPFASAGIPGADFAATGKFPELHTTADRVQVVNPGHLQQTGDQILSLIRELGNQAAFDTSLPDQTFFPIFGRLMHYPSSLALPLAILAGLCFLGTIIFGVHKRGLTWRGLIWGFLAFFLNLVLNAGIISLLWSGIQSLHPGYGYSPDRAHLSDDHLYALGFIFLSLAITITVIAYARKKIAALDLGTGAFLFWFPMMIAAAVMIPATSYVFTWVLLFGSLAIQLAFSTRAKKAAWVLSGIGFLVCAVLATFLWMPILYFAFLGSSFPMLWLMTSLVALWLGGIFPALDWITVHTRWPLAKASLLVSLGFLVAGHFLVGKDSPPPLVSPVGYWLDANNDAAYWIAFADELDERQTNLLVKPNRQSYPELFPEAPQIPVLTSAAPILDLEGPRLEVISDEGVGNRRAVKARVITSLHERLFIIIPREAPLLAITIADSQKTELPPVEDRALWLRFEGIPVEGIEVIFEFSSRESFQFLLVEEKTGLPSFPGLMTQPELGTMKSPGVFTQIIPTDFTAIHREWVLQKRNP